MKKTFQTPEPLRLHLALPAGVIEIETHSGGETELELEPLRDDDVSREAVESATVDLRGGELRVEVHERRGWLRTGPGPEVALRLRTPHGAGVRARVASADVTGRGRYASVDVRAASGDVAFDDVAEDAAVETASGDVQLGGVGGDLSVNSASGDVTIGRLVGRGSVETASGDLHLRETYSDLSTQTVSGDQQIDAAVEGRLKLQSVAGDVLVGIARGSRVVVDASALSGSTSSELPLSDAPGDEDGPLVEVRAGTISGDFRIVRSDAPAELAP